MATTQVVIDINTPQGVTIPQFVDTMATHWGYQPTFLDTTLDPPRMVNNPLTKAQFVKRKVADYIKQQYIDARVLAKLKTAQQEESAAAGELTTT